MTPPSPLAVELSHVRLRVARSRCGTLGDRLLDHGNIAAAQLHCHAGKRLRQLVSAACAENWHDIATLCADPRNRRLRNRNSLCRRELAKRLHEGKVRCQISALKTRAHGAKISPACPAWRPMAADQAPGKHAVSGKPDTKLTQGVQNFALDPARWNIRLARASGNPAKSEHAGRMHGLAG